MLIIFQETVERKINTINGTGEIRTLGKLGSSEYVLAIIFGFLRTLV